MINHTSTSRRALGVIGGAVAFGLVLSGCSTTGETAESTGAFTNEYTGPAVELSYWNGFTGGDGPFMQQMVDQFNSEHENITVVSNTIPWGDFYSKLPAAISAGEGPDVGVMHLDQLATHAVRDLIIPLDDLATGLELTADDFTEEVWSAGEFNGARYGIPLDVHSLAMYYNTEHFEAAGITEAPTDAASFQEALEKLQAAGYETPFWMPSKWPSHLMNLSLTWQFGGDPYPGGGETVGYDSDAAVEALAWQRSIIDQGFSPADVAGDAQYIAFKNGETSITWDGIWQFNDLTASGMPYAAAPIPAIGGQAAVWANSHNFFIPKADGADADKVQAAKVFIAWMSEQSATWAGSGMIPARLSVRDAGALDGQPQAMVAEGIESMRFLPAVPGLGGVQQQTLEIAVANGVLGTQSPADAMKEAATKANALLEENRATFGG